MEKTSKQKRKINFKSKNKKDFPSHDIWDIYGNKPSIDLLTGRDGFW